MVRRRFAIQGFERDIPDQPDGCVRLMRLWGWRRVQQCSARILTIGPKA